MKADRKNECADNDMLYGAFCADLRNDFAGKTAPADVVERITRRASLEEKTTDAANVAMGKRAGKKSAFVVAAVGVAACLAMLTCFVPLRLPSANADVVVNECRSIPRDAMAFTGYYQVGDSVRVQFEASFEWREPGVSSVTYSVTADGVSIWLADETFSRGSGIMEGDGKQATAYYSYTEDGSAFARCLITVDLGLAGEVERSHIEQVARDALAGVEVNASAQLDSGEKKDASCEIL
ncbi:hypothetical protein [uncultured Senegalimassilia sp.]|uniref:hypothetical protein n=1 Tax=uncultured Senegalimassilia sp. TaxID=1714350 RepID=UPI0025E9C4CA|nr:hypothetical protein [uncultured Senegalimassilia sp.]